MKNSILKLNKNNFAHNVWGGQWILDWKGIPAVDDKPVGETWEFSGHPHHPSQVETDQGIVSLADLVKKKPNLLTTAGLKKSDQNAVPFLVKVIDAAQNLSVQVHPSDEYAKEKENSFGKEEAWVILDVGPAPDDGFIYLGFKESVSKEDVQTGKILPLINKIKVKPGDIYHLNPGVIHAIGKGIRAFEIQQNSDITYRIWDWDRADKRPLHTDKALDVLEFKSKELSEFKHQPIPVQAKGQGNFSEKKLIESKKNYFSVSSIELKGKQSQIQIDSKGIFSVLTAIRGDVQVLIKEEKVPLKQGHSALVPAEIPQFSLQAETQEALVFRSTVPA